EQAAHVPVALPVGVDHDRIDLDRVVTLRKCLARGGRVLRGFDEVAGDDVPVELQLARIGAQRTRLAGAEQAPDRLAERLALDVPERDVDRAHRTEHDRSAAFGPEGTPEHAFPDALIVHRIGAEQRSLRHVAHHAGAAGRADAVAQADLADAGDAGIGACAHIDRIPAQDAVPARTVEPDNVDFDDAHRLLLPFDGVDRPVRYPARSANPEPAGLQTGDKFRNPTDAWMQGDWMQARTIERSNGGNYDDPA